MATDRTTHDDVRTDARSTLRVHGHPIDPTRPREVCHRYGVIELAVFGSVARGEATGSSDGGLRYVLAPGARLGVALNRVEDELAGLFPRPVKLVSKKALHRLLRDDVLAGAQTLHAA